MSGEHLHGYRLVATIPVPFRPDTDLVASVGPVGTPLRPVRIAATGELYAARNVTNQEALVVAYRFTGWDDWSA